MEKQTIEIADAIEIAETTTISADELKRIDVDEWITIFVRGLKWNGVDYTVNVRITKLGLFQIINEFVDSKIVATMFLDGTYISWNPSIESTEIIKFQNALHEIAAGRDVPNATIVRLPANHPPAWCWWFGSFW